MAQDIVIAGATFNAVPSIVVPTSGNGTAVFVDPSPTTATDSDVASGKVYFKADGTQSTGTASGGSATLITKSITANGTYNASSDNADGYSQVTVNVSGGASNVVTGTFELVGTGGATDISIPYTGSGYPIMVEICPKEGATNPNGTYGSTVNRRKVGMYVACKNVATTAPYYSGGSNDTALIYARYKNSTSDATVYSGSAVAAGAIYTTSGAGTSAAGDVVKIKSPTTISVYGGGTYGFMMEVEYRYTVTYSS